MTPPHAPDTDSNLNYGVFLPNWHVGADTEQLVEFAVAAEDAGWDGVFLADHLAFPHDRYEGPEAMDFHDPWITMAGVATRTEELTLASLITPIPRRLPWQLARNLATLDRLSHGRVLLGTGLGIPSTNYTPFGRQDDLVTLGQRYDEGLEVIDGLWRGEPFSYDGEHFTIDDAALLPTPIQEPRIPIVAGGVWPNKTPIRRGARWDGIAPAWEGDGAIPGDRGVPPAETVREIHTYYHDHTDESGEIILPMNPPDSSPDYLDVCRNLGVTWVYTRDLRKSEFESNPELAIDRIRGGPEA